MNMSKKTKQVKVMVVSLGVIILSSIWAGRERGCVERERGREGERNLFSEDPEGSSHNGEGGGHYLEQEGEGDHPVSGLARWSLHYILVHRLHPQTAGSVTKVKGQSSGGVVTSELGGRP